MKLLGAKEFEERFKKAFGLDFPQWYCDTFLPYLTGKENVERIRAARPQNYKELESFFTPFLRNFVFVKQDNLKKKCVGCTVTSCSPNCCPKTYTVAALLGRLSNRKTES